MNDKKYCIYKHVFPNNKVYIGQTCQKVERRWRKGKGYIDNALIWNAIQKYGWENIKHEIICTDLNLEQANVLERLLILCIYKSNIRENGYNIDEGGASANSTKDSHWYNNGIIERRFKTYPGKEWRKGQLPSHHENCCKPRVVNGKIYKSLKAVMEELNVNKNQARILCGMKIKKDIRIRITIDGIEYQSIQEAHRKTGLSLRQLNKIRGLYKTKGYNYDRITIQCKPIIINGKKYKSRTRAIKELKTNKYTINKLIKEQGDVITTDIFK